MTTQTRELSELFRIETSDLTPISLDELVESNPRRQVLIVTRTDAAVGTYEGFETRADGSGYIELSDFGMKGRFRTNFSDIGEVSLWEVPYDGDIIDRIGGIEEIPAKPSHAGKFAAWVERGNVLRCGVIGTLTRDGQYTWIAPIGQDAENAYSPSKLIYVEGEKRA